MARIVIDAGHGGVEPGSIYEGRREKDDNLRLALAVGDILEKNGIEGVYTRTTDVYDSPLEKAEIGNQSGADFFVSIHRNAMPVPGSASGVESLVYSLEGPAVRMAENIDRALARVGFADLGVKERPNLIVLKRSGMPAVLVEAGFLDNEVDNQLFDEKFDQIARAIADGILESLQPVPLYSVQVGAFRDRRDADQMVQQLEREGFPAHLVYEDGYFKVRVSAFEKLDNAVDTEQRLKAHGYDTYMIII